MANPRDLAEQAFALLQNALRDSEDRAAALEERLQRESDACVEEQLAATTLRLEKVEIECRRWEQQARNLEEIAEAERAKVAQLKKKLDIAESGPEKLTKQEINFWRAKAERFDTETQDYKTRLAQLRRDLNERDALIAQLRDSPRPAATPDSTEAAAVHRAQQHAVAAALTNVEQRLKDSEVELESLRIERDAACTRVTLLATEHSTAKEQIAALERDLKDEREHAENMAELANERRELMTTLQEQLEEAEERLADANYRLGKAAHFERLVKRRKGLVRKLLDALRAKTKATVALKAGLDGLRTYKAAAEMNQQKLLQRIEALKTELREAEDAAARAEDSTKVAEERAASAARIAALETRLTTQAELIESLENDLETARFQHRAEDARRPPSGVAPKTGDADDNLRERDATIARLMMTIRDQETNLRKLSEASESWRRQYQLLASNSTKDYKTAGEN